MSDPRSDVPAPPGRRTRTQRGRRGEDLAVRALVGLGYRIRARNVRWSHGEIDLVAQDGEVLVFVEVRSASQSRFGDPRESLTARKRHRLQVGAKLLLARWRIPDPRCRFDLVTVHPRTDRGTIPVRVLKDVLS